MAKRKTNNKNTKKKTGASSAVMYEVKLISAVTVFILYLIFLISKNTGVIGNFLREATLGLFGLTGYLLPFMLLVITLSLINKNLVNVRNKFIYGALALFVALLILVNAFGYEIMDSLVGSDVGILSKEGVKISFDGGVLLDGSGVLGNLITFVFVSLFGMAGLYVVSLALLLIAVVLLTNYKFSSFASHFKFLRQYLENRKKKEKPKAKKAERKKEIIINNLSEPTPVKKKEDKKEDRKEDRKVEIKKSKKEIPNFDDSVGPKEPEVEKPKPDLSGLEKDSTPEKLDDNIQKKETVPYNKPDIDFLDKGQTVLKGQIEDRELMLEKAELLEDTLKNFGVVAKVIEISRGPTITRYELEPAPGTKVSKIVGLSDDIALNLAATHVRVAPVPGKVAVGIEIPNSENATVVLREILESREFREASSKLAIGLGKDISGKSVVADLAKMPHLLIAGATGSGKSVCVNTIITSILYNSTPDEVKLLMIDPKVVELNVYNGIPHLILPVVTDPKKASIALGWAVNEMTKRYEKFAELGVKDLEGFNKKSSDEKMPKIVIIIDELADLMMVAPNQVEDAIARLAQMARAAGIHLIVATQRPSVDVITGLIKANIPSRIAFSVSSSIDSRTILDMSGAEKLLGKGDMLFNPVGASKPKRLQGAFISEDEIEKIVKHIKKTSGEAEYDEAILEKSSVVMGSDESDELLPDAIRLVVELKQASASMLQRKFRIGYNRAARLIDEMEERGIIGPALGSKPREVIIDESDLEDGE